MADAPPVVQLHHPADSRFSLKFITDEWTDRIRKAQTLTENPDIEVAVREDIIDGDQLYLLYTKTRFDAAYQSFETTAEVLDWLNANFSDTDKQILFVVIDAFDGIISETEDADGTFSTYKKMDLEAIPAILNSVEWRQSVPEVGAELLSQFILTHPMPNTNHRTGLSLLDRYLASYDPSATLPATGEAGQWYDWIKGYIYDSKRLLTLRNNLQLLYWARQYGYEVAERKEGIRIELSSVDLERSDPWDYYADRHLDLTREFIVSTVLEQVGAPQLRERTDDGKRAFADRLRAAR
ncbi:hypothetical protein HAPAU_38670 [Halalkalicoccus paucihalophilus]|uniref:Uncharacterized protein n=1 Tax=Halalkalicoccus paucihalophilus TaxID=1008153 RepID=A0A151A7W0_9EURY|nr:hypothetical protein [Halalkalicoccus paucihalophilus]KYH23788.1 hypothetical protein HAPAU_38670 [Halalkalicoccus paucihalophilus]